VQFALSYAHAMKNLQQGYIVIRETMRKFIQKEIDESKGKIFRKRVIKEGLVDGTF